MGNLKHHRFVNLCWVLGHFVGAGVLRAANDIKGTWSFRMPFAVQWVWLPFLIPAMIFAPESPYWYVRKGKLDQAERTVARLAPAADRERVHEVVSSMVRTNELEKEVHQGTSFVDCFRGVDRRRTEIRLVGSKNAVSIDNLQHGGLDNPNSLRSTVRELLNLFLPAGWSFNFILVRYDYWSVCSCLCRYLRFLDPPHVFWTSSDLAHRSELSRRRPDFDRGPVRCRRQGS